MHLKAETFTCTSGDGFSTCPAEVSDGVVELSWLDDVCGTASTVSERSDKRRRFSATGCGCDRLRSSSNGAPTTLCKRESFSSTADFCTATFASKIPIELIWLSQLRHKQAFGSLVSNKLSKETLEILSNRALTSLQLSPCSLFRHFFSFVMTFLHKQHFTSISVLSLVASQNDLLCRRTYYGSLLHRIRA